MAEMAQVMTPAHFRWGEVVEALSGPGGCDFRRAEDGEWVWTCDGDKARPKARAVLEGMGGIDVEASLVYFGEHGGHCDCEIVFNVEANAAG